MKLKRVICGFCQKEFETPYGRKKYCSASCRDKAASRSEAEKRKCKCEEKSEKKKEQPVKKDANKTRLAKENAKARELHMTYGRYKAMKYMEEQRNVSTVQGL